MRTWLVPREELTPEQLRGIELNPSEHRIVAGGPGSGKTQILLHRARHLCDTYQVKPQKFRIMVYTNALKNYIESALDLLDLSAETLTTFDHWCHEFYKEHIGRPPRNPKTKQPDFDLIREGVHARISEDLFWEPLYDFVMVDEGQDLDRRSYEILTRIARHITVCVDSRQKIYDHGKNEADIASHLKVRQRNIFFLSAFRCCPYVTQLAAALIPGSKEREDFVRQCRSAQTERSQPLLYWAKDFEDETRRLREVLAGRLRMKERIAILLPQGRQVFGYAKGLREAGFEVETQKELDFASDLPKILTYHSAKGLTFDSVLLPRLVPMSFTNWSAEWVNRLLFVGITRAAKWVYMSTVPSRGRILESLERIQELGDQGILAIQKSNGKPAAGTSGGPRESAMKDDLLDML